MRATTLLAANTERLLHEAVAAADGWSFDAEQPWDERLAGVRRGAFDVVWACGLLTAELIVDGVPLVPVGVPSLDGFEDGRYRSVIVAREGDDAERWTTGRVGVNEYGSWSGWHAYRIHLERSGRSVDDHSSIVLTGGHAQSLELLRSGAVDVVSIDSSVWVSEQHEGLEVVEQTDWWPAPPVSVRSDSERSLVDELVGLHASGVDTAPYTAMQKLCD